MMKIGMTYDLRSAYLAEGCSADETAEFDREDTIDAIESTLGRLGHEPERIGHARQLAAALVAGKRWDLVFNIAEGINGIGREAQVPALLDIYGIPYTFSDPLTMSLTLHKGMTKRVVRDAGIPTADFLVVEDLQDLSDLSFEPPYFAKPVAEGTGKGVSAESVCRDRAALATVCERLLSVYRQPVLVESFLPGREFTVGILGTGRKARAIGSIEVILREAAEPGGYSYKNKAQYEKLVAYQLVRPSDPSVEKAEAIAVHAWQVLGCRDAGRIDIRCDAKGRPMFIEVNPLAGIHPEHSDLPIICRHLGIPYETLIGDILDAARERMRG